MHKNYNYREGDHASKNDDTPMCKRHEANYIQSEEYQNQDSHDSYSHQMYHDRNDSEKSLTKLNNDVRNDLEDFKRRIRSMRTVHWKLFDRDDSKTTCVLSNKKSKTVNQEPQSKTDLEQSITKFLDGQRVTNIFFKNNVNDEWSKSQIVSLKQTDRTDPPSPQAHTEQVNAVFTERGKSDDSPKIQTLPPIIVKDKPIKTSKGNYHIVKTKEYPFLLPKRTVETFVLLGLEYMVNAAIIIVMLLIAVTTVNLIFEVTTVSIHNVSAASVKSN
ncbi:hypothetical protein Tco_1319506 [Tanacetum coccineum]